MTVGLDSETPLKKTSVVSVARGVTHKPEARWPQAASNGVAAAACASASCRHILRNTPRPTRRRHARMHTRSQLPLPRPSCAQQLVQLLGTHSCWEVNCWTPAAVIYGRCAEAVRRVVAIQRRQGLCQPPGRPTRPAAQATSPTHHPTTPGAWIQLLYVQGARAPATSSKEGGGRAVRPPLACMHEAPHLSHPRQTAVKCRLTCHKTKQKYLPRDLNYVRERTHSAPRPTQCLRPKAHKKEAVKRSVLS